MSRLQLLICISAICLQVLLLSSAQDDCAFAIHPKDKTVEVNDTDVELSCMPVLDTQQFITWQLFLRNGTFWTVSAADVELQLSRGLQFFPANGSLRIIRVQPFHAGLYRCEGLGIQERCLYFSDNATVTVRGPAEVKIVGRTFLISTTETLQINGIISGQPDPTITLCKIENGREVIISNDHPRIIIIVFIATRLTITIEDVCVNDSGVYRVKAANEVGGSSTDFTIIVQGEATTMSCASITTSPTDTEYTTTYTGFEQTNPGTTENGTTDLEQTSPEIMEYATTAFEETSAETTKYATTVFEETASGCCNCLSLPAAIMCLLITLYF